MFSLSTKQAKRRSLALCSAVGASLLLGGVTPAGDAEGASDG